MTRFAGNIVLMTLLALTQSVYCQCGFDLVNPNVKHVVKDGYESGSIKSQLTIPVVVHVIHKGEPAGTGYNVDDATIVSALECMNDRYAGIVGNGPNTGIEFCLAQIDPFGNSTNGIDRIDGSIFPNYLSMGLELNFSQCVALSSSDLSQAVRWPVENYYNIYLVWEMCPTGVASAFAYSPSFAGNDFDGTYCRVANFTCNETVPTHELGHAMGLRHTFQGQNGTQCPVNDDCQTDGDDVCDTPPHRSIDCGATNPCQVDQSDWINSRENYMSYCFGLNRFTSGQVQRMRSSIHDYRTNQLVSTVCGVGIGLEDYQPIETPKLNILYSLKTPSSIIAQGNHKITSVRISDLLGREVTFRLTKRSDREIVIDLVGKSGAYVISAEMKSAIINKAFVAGY